MIEKLPRREREVFEILCREGEATAGDVRRLMSDAPSDSAVRTLLSRLEGKGMITHREAQHTYYYKSVQQPEKIRDKALAKVVDTFFEGSGVSAATALLGRTKKLSAEEIEALQKLIDAAKKRRKE